MEVEREAYANSFLPLELVPARPLQARRGLLLYVDSPLHLRRSSCVYISSFSFWASLRTCFCRFDTTITTIIFFYTGQGANRRQLPS